MNQLVRHMEYLLRSGDGCAVIPGVGAVISRRVPARYDAAAGRFMPPAVEYSFNSALTHSDGALASSVARSRGIAFEQGVRIVEDSASAMRRALREGLPVSLGRIGSLMLRDGRISFIPFAYRLLASPSVWLQPVTLKPVVAASGVAEASEEDDAREFASAIRTAWRRTAVRAVRIAASVALVLAVGFGVAMTLGRTAPFTEKASLGFEFSGQSAPLITRPGTSSSPLVLVLRQHDDAATQVDTAAIAAGREVADADVLTEKPEPSAVLVQPYGPEGSAYCLVVASLSSREEAERYVGGRNDNLRILETDGRYRVYAASGESSADVRRKAGALGLDSRYPGAWVCRR